VFDLKYLKAACVYRIASGFLFSILLSACSTTLEIDKIRSSPDFASHKPVNISVPFYAQEEYQCGPAALAMLLNWASVSVSPEQLKNLVYVPDKQGSFPLEIMAAARQFDRLPYVIKPDLSALISELESGNPVLVFQNLGLSWLPKWHFAVVTGIDLAANEITLHSGTIENHKMTLEKFERTWQRADKWAIVAMRAGQLPKSAEPLSFLKAVSYFEQHAKLNFAKSFYESAVQRWPDQPVVLMAMANISYRLKSFDTASEYYRKIISIDDSYAPAHNNLALVLIEQDNLSEAKKHALRAVSIGGKRSENYRETLNQLDRLLQQNAEQSP